MIKNFKKYNESVQKTAEEVVLEYSKKYPKHKKFFNDIIELYPNDKYFRERLLDKYLDIDDDDLEDGLSDNELFGRSWDAESEVYMIESELIEDFPGIEIWVDFYNDLNDSIWGKITLK